MKQNTVDMRATSEEFEEVGSEHVKDYIPKGNIVHEGGNWSDGATSTGESNIGEQGRVKALMGYMGQAKEKISRRYGGFRAPVIIGVMGKTGTGKTSFINAVTGSTHEVSHGLSACTQDIQVSETKFGGQTVQLVDTPGFDDTGRSDVDILELIANWLRLASSNDVKLSGIIYLHRIIDPRMEGSHMRNIHMFRRLCGENNFGNVTLCTTMWDKVDPLEGEQRELELRTQGSFWGHMIEVGAEVRRHKGPDLHASAREIAKELVGKSTIVLQLQEELAEHSALSKTAAGKFLIDGMAKMEMKHQKEMEALRAEMRSLGNSLIDIAALREYYNHELEGLKKAKEEQKKLRDNDKKAYEEKIAELQEQLDKKSGG